jgi:hypothetical protein
MTFSTPTTPRGTKASTAFSLKPPGDLLASEGRYGTRENLGGPLSVNFPSRSLGSLGALGAFCETLY